MDQKWKTLWADHPDLSRSHRPRGLPFYQQNGHADFDVRRFGLLGHLVEVPGAAQLLGLGFQLEDKAGPRSSGVAGSTGWSYNKNPEPYGSNTLHKGKKDG